MTATQKVQNPRTQFSGSIVVGKDVLELLSSAMYVDPLTIYREFIQNAADSIDEAIGAGLYSGDDKPRIDINLDLVARTARIRDNGTGIPRNWVLRRLTSIGASKKRGTGARGFRGVGRISGLAYCQELIFRTRATSDEPVYEMHWDCRLLKELLRDPVSDLDLQSLLHMIIEAGDTVPDADFPTHFFEVELRQIPRHRNDILLNEDVVSHYLSQVGPVPFSSRFRFGKQIQQLLEEFNAGKTYEIFVNGAKKPIIRPFQVDFEGKKGSNNAKAELESFQISGIGDGTDAIGWVLHHDYLGAIPDAVGIKGLRARVGNIQIGDSVTFNSVFPETRFNSWAIGEIHVLSPRIVPNGRRDDFEHSKHYANLLNSLAPKAKAIAKRCREQSATRTRAKTVNTDIPAPNVNLDWSRARAFLAKHAKKKLSQKHRNILKNLLRRNGGVTYAELYSCIVQAHAKSSRT